MQVAIDNADFVVHDLDIMADARNYRRYLASLFAPFVRGDALEIGPGIGNITSEVIRACASGLRSMCCVEEDAACVSRLEEWLQRQTVPHEVIRGTFPRDIPDRSFDCIYHANVLEHIENDRLAVRTCIELLRPGGHLLMYVPAFPILFGSMDVLLKHYRRYTRAGLCQLLTESGFEIVTSRYCNFLGFWAWFLNNRILRITSQKSNQVQFFDRVLLPIQARLETYWQPWVGQNLFVMARRNG